MAPPTTPEEVKRRIQDAIGQASPQGEIEHLHNVILLHPEKHQRDQYIDAQRRMMGHVQKLRYFLSHNNYGVLATNAQDRVARIRRSCAKAWEEYRGLRAVLADMSWQLDNNRRAFEKKGGQAKLVDALTKAHDEAELLLISIGPDEGLEWPYY